MGYRRSLVYVALLMGLSTPLQAADVIRKVTGERVSCSVTKVSATEVAYDESGEAKTLPTSEILEISWDGEPAPLTSARSNARNASHANVLKLLEKIDKASVTRPEVAQDLEYLRVMATAKLALGGQGEIADAGKKLNSFVSENANHYQIMHARELLGELFVAFNKPDEALKQYKFMRDSGLPTFQIRAGIASGRANMSRQKFPEALAAFEEALTAAGTAKGKQFQAEKLAASLGKAVCLAETGTPEEGVKLAEETVDSMDPEDADLRAQGYLALGKCLRKKPDGARAALLAFLHVDVLYNSNAQAHAEALYNLAAIWNEVGKPDRSVQAMELLKERYAKSPWAK